MKTRTLWSAVALSVLATAGSLPADPPAPAAEGVRFTAAYAAAPVCIPTRAAIRSPEPGYAFVRAFG